MSESFIPVNGTNPAKNLETSELTNSNGDIVHREGVMWGDPLDVNALANVSNVGGNNSALFGGHVITHDPANSPVRDAFGRLRVSNPITLFDSTLEYDKGRLYWEEILEGSATSVHDADGSCIDMAVTANAPDHAVRQTREYFRYQPGKSQAIVMTFVCGVATAGVTKRVGYYDGENGIFYQQGPDGRYDVVVRSKVSGSVVEDSVTQADWNLDKLDGTGASGITVDLTKGTVLFIDLQWLSLGRVRIGLEFAGVLTYVHEFLHAGIVDGAYMTTANLPMKYEIFTDGTNGDKFKTICSAVMSEGGFELGRGSRFCVALDGTDQALKSSVTAATPIISIRPKLTLNSITNRGLILPSMTHFLSLSKIGFFTVVWGGTLTSASWGSVGDDSICEVDYSATAITGGIPIGADYVERKGGGVLSSSNRYPMTLLRDGTHPTALNNTYTDCLTIVGTSLETATSMGGGIVWTEIR